LRLSLHSRSHSLHSLLYFSSYSSSSRCFFFHHTPPPDLYTLSLHDALPILYSTPIDLLEIDGRRFLVAPRGRTQWVRNAEASGRSEERRVGKECRCGGGADH